MQIIIILPLCLALSGALLVPRTRPHPRRRLHTHFPAALRAKGQTIQPNLRIPNEKFCREMRLKSAPHSMVMPWWQSYCDNLNERVERRYEHSQFNLPLYRKVLDKVNAYKKEQERRKQYLQR